MSKLPHEPRDTIMATYKEIIYQVADPVAVITLDRPNALNALTSRMLAEIKHALAAAESDEQVVGIVLTGAERGFCAGMDMNDLAATASGNRPTEDLQALDAQPGDPAMGEDFQVTFGYLLSIRKPLIAAINGACAGLGFVIACLADMRFVETQAKFTTSFAQRGLVAEHGISWVLPRLIGSGRALDILWSARKFTGDEAFQLGLAERVFETGKAKEEAINYIKALAMHSSPQSIMLMKAQVYRHLNTTLGPAMKETNILMTASLEQDGFKEGVNSFMEKRLPKFARVTTDSPPDKN